MVLTSYRYPNHALLPGCCSAGTLAAALPKPLALEAGNTNASRYKQHTLFTPELKVWESLSAKPHWGAWNRLGEGRAPRRKQRAGNNPAFAPSTTREAERGLAEALPLTQQPQIRVRPRARLPCAVPIPMQPPLRAQPDQEVLHEPPGLCPDWGSTDQEGSLTGALKPSSSATIHRS